MPKSGLNEKVDGGAWIDGVGSKDFSKRHDNICDQPLTINKSYKTMN